MDGFSKCERIGREKMNILCENLNLAFKENPKQYDCYDGTIEYHGKKYIVELKDRSEKYNLDSILLEKSKYDNIIECCTTLSADGAYYVSFFSNDAYILKLDDSIDVEPISIKANKHTSISDGKIDKLVYMVPKNKFKKYRINGEKEDS